MKLTFSKLAYTLLVEIQFNRQLSQKGGFVPVRQIRLFSLFLVLAAQPSTIESQATDWARLHAHDDAAWAARSGLSEAEVRKLRAAVGVNDGSSEFIDNIDTRTLAPYKLALFATFDGTARCVNFWLLSETGDTYKVSWNSEEGGKELNFCADPKCDTPLVKAMPNRDIEVEIPTRRKGRCVSGSYGFLKWTGTTYSYKGILTRHSARDVLPQSR